MPKETLTIPCLGDLHFGAARTEGLEAELEAHFFPWLRASRFDALVQLGDLFDKRLGVDTAAAKAALRFVVGCCQVCQERGAPFRMLRGTLTHDAYQLELLRPLETEFSTFRTVAAAAEEELLPGFRALYLPEDYPAHYGDYYSQFLYGPDQDGQGGQDIVYDAIFGHGEIDVAAGWSQATEGERHYGGTPVHEAERLLQHCRGPVQFGHIHNRFRFKKRLGYSGSFTRWCQGEEDGKGFDVLKLSRASAAKPWSVAVERVANPAAPRYVTVRAEEILEPDSQPDEMVAAIRGAAGGEEGGCHLRVRFDGFPVDLETLSIVRGALVEDRRVQLQVLARGGAAPAAEAAEGAPEARARLGYLRDQSVPAPERLLRYIAETNPGSGVTLEDVLAITAPLA